MTCIVALVAAFVLGGLFYLLFAQGARCLEERRERREIERLEDERRARERMNEARERFKGQLDEMNAGLRRILHEKALSIEVDPKEVIASGEDSRRFMQMLTEVVKKSVRERAEKARETAELADTINRNVSSTGQDFVILRDPPTWTDQ